MWSDVSGSAVVEARFVTTERHVWLLHLVGRWLLRSAAAASCCHVPYDVRHADAGDLIAPALWWRHEAARGLAQLERTLVG